MPSTKNMTSLSTDAPPSNIHVYGRCQVKQGTAKANSNFVLLSSKHHVKEGIGAETTSCIAVLRFAFQHQPLSPPL